MTVAELFELGDCDQCPFMRENICPGGWKSGAGGEPIEPPCTSWSDDDFELDAEDLLHQYYAAESAWERYMDDLEEAKRIKSEKNAKRAETRRKMESYCYAERAAVKMCKKQIKALEHIISFARSITSAYNITNEMFRYEERYQANPELQSKLDTWKEKLEEAEIAYKNKRKEFYNNRKNEESGK